MKLIEDLKVSGHGNIYLQGPNSVDRKINEMIERINYLSGLVEGHIARFEAHRHLTLHNDPTGLPQ